ncbi:MULTISPECIES: bifunctional copper resistance protein CopD/cytochrome c oxidase assembly protein [Rhodococcus]|nr:MULTISPECIES: bifunctional copper resistance protein CopD/cytochrome c oxidase assembly protein [Rhodococcus]KZF15982.1 copper resistance protein CopD [Rhodococcus sp. EPR-134]MBY6389389.1 bifunctional copper resistance protein CopD/cytochrome c oxidase assembly protein [Rhodococcus erythropolis]QTS03656.1 bifunctional copper resistance protein CopD/cytochrome c oxidase assembly protein [Rhodococcus qingshengii]
MIETEPSGADTLVVGRPIRKVLGWGVIAAITAAALARASTSEALRLLGLPDPGPLTIYGLPAVMAFGEVAAVMTVGSLLLAAVLVPPQASGVLDVDGYLALRTASVAAAIWAVCAALLVPLTLSDSSGQPLSVVFADPGLFARAISDIDVTTAWAWTAGLALVLAIACRLTLRYSWTPLLLAFALFSLLPRALSGHSSSGGSHDIATNSLVLHILAASIWMGGIAALVLHARRKGSYLDFAARRFSAVALMAFVVIAISGVVNAAVRVPLTAVWSSTYGVLILAKVAALVLTGLAGWRQRKIAIAELTKDPSDGRTFIRLAVVESVVLAVTVGIAVALGRTPPPAPTERQDPSRVEEVLGYALDGVPTAGRLLVDWRFDLIFGTLAVVLAACYVVGVFRLRQQGVQWSTFRSVSWALGCLVLLVATSSGVGRYAPAVMSMHMAATSAVAVLAPLCLVLGAPFTLFRLSVRRSSGDAPGLREWAQSVYRGSWFRFMSQPYVIAVIFAGALPLLYLGGMYSAVAGSHVPHLVINGTLLICGFMFFWVMVGVDPLPRRASAAIRTTLLLAAFLAYGGLAAALIATDTVIADQYFASLQRGWLDDFSRDQRFGAGLIIAIGAVPLAIATGFLLTACCSPRCHRAAHE